MRHFQLSTLAKLCLPVLLAAVAAYAQITPLADSYTNTATPKTNFGSKLLLYVRQTRHVSGSLVAVEGVEQSAVQHRLKPAPQALQLEGVSRSKLNLDPTVDGFLSGNRQCRFSHINAQNRQSQRGDVKSVLAGPAARIEHRSSESAFGCQTHYCRLRLANIPRRGAVVVRRIPGQSRHPFVTGWAATTKRIVS
jgi:hypothetical protein